MRIAESAEMYIESIFVLYKTFGKVRSIDVAEHLGYSKPSVSRAVGLLKKAGHILVDQNGFITLTESGLEIANKTYERHTVLTNCFTLLGVDKDVASADACKIEHVISDEVFLAIKSFLKQKTDL